MPPPIYIPSPPNMRRPIVYEVIMLSIGTLMTVASLFAFVLSGEWKMLFGFVFFGAGTVSSFFTIRKLRKSKQRQQWLDAGCCPQCGYDLRATPEKCPECGYIKPIPPKPAVWTGRPEDYWSK